MIELNVPSAAGEVVQAVPWDLIIFGVVLVVVGIILLFLLKRVIENIVLGLIGWAVVQFVFGISLPPLQTFIAIVLFGLAGLGTMVVITLLG